MHHKLVSIALASYNGAAFIKRQIDSILEQSYSPIEIIVSDDCSTDGTFEILKEYESNKQIFLVQNATRQGYVKNFENAINLCKGHWIALADQDDWWEKDKIKILVESVGEQLLIHSDAKLIDQDDIVLHPSYTRFSKKITVPQTFVEILVNGCVTGCTSLGRKDFFDSILPFPNDLYVHDKWMGIFAFLRHGLTYCDQPLVLYRQHQQNNIGALNPTIGFFQRLKNAIFNWKNIDVDSIRSTFEKERKLIELVQLHGRLSDENASSIQKLLFFYQGILSGEKFFSTTFFYFSTIAAFEKGKPITQKLYFFSLILLVFFAKKKVK